MPTQSLTLGRIAAIPIRLHWSWPLLFGLLAVALRPIYTSHACVDAGLCGHDLSLAALMAGLIGASVLVHELGHALVAHHLTVPVRSITLFAFGGIAEAEHEAPNPGVDFAVALAGPAANLLIAGGGGLLWWLTAAGGGPRLIGLLAAANLILALLNLLPGYPMDGGRVLRAVLWFLGDDRLPATRVTAQIGRACGVALSFGGSLLALLFRLPALAVWALLVGGFLYRIAHLSYRRIVLEGALRGVTVGSLMQRRVRTVAPDLNLDQFVARHVLGQSETSFAVVAGAADSPRLLGMITLRAMRRFTNAQWSAHTVADAMTPLGQIVALAPQTPALDAVYRLNDSPDGLLPVVDGDQLVGLLRARDVAVFIQVQLARQK